MTNVDELELLREVGMVSNPSDETLDHAFALLREAMDAEEGLTGEEPIGPSSPQGVPEPGGKRPRLSTTRRRRRVVFAGPVAALAAALLVVLLLPSVGQKSPVAAAAQLRLIADHASDQPVRQLASNQWLETQQRVSYTTQVTELDSESVSNVTASIPGTVTQWSNDFGESCWTTVIGAATFSSPTNKAAWEAAGFPDTPTNSNDGTCATASGANVANGQGGGVVNVASLPTDPATLAHELQTGTTGIEEIDAGSGPPSDPSAGLARAALLLLGPTTGSSPSLTAVIYRALALMPSITQLGEVTTHSGQSGLGFASNSPDFGERAIIVDPSTGQLLELRNLTTLTPSEAMSMAVEQGYPFPAAGSGAGSDGSANLDWIDPVGSSRVVDSIPSTLAPRLPSLTAQVVATETPGTYQSTNDLQTLLNSQFNHMLGGGPSVLNGSLVLNLDFDGPASEVPEFVAAIKDSGLFHSVVVTNGPNA
jgi:hypothetical protein